MSATTGAKNDLMTAIRGLSAARELPPEIILDALKAALRSAYDKIPGREGSNVSVDISESTGETRVYAHYTVTEEQFIEDPQSEMTPERAREHNPDAVIGDVITFDVTPSDFGRIAAQTAKQVILQRIREAEREQTYLTYADREGEIVYGTVQTANRDLVTVALDRVEAVLPRGGQIPGEHYTPNQRIRVFVAEVKRSPKGPQIIVSRAHKMMLRRLMEVEIPEVHQGIVEIKGIAREAGSRSKVSVWSSQTGVDPVGACVGMRGVRIQALVRELGGEKIDIVEWNPDPRVYIKHALSPARVVHVWLEPSGEETTVVRGTANVVVPDDQLSLAIGREGQNARLAAKLTGWRIDIRAESEAADIIERVKAEEATLADELALHAAAAREAAAARDSAAAQQDELEGAVAPAAADGDGPIPATDTGAEVDADAEPIAAEAVTPEEEPDGAAGTAEPDTLPVAAELEPPVASFEPDEPDVETPESKAPAAKPKFDVVPPTDFEDGDDEYEIDSSGRRSRKKRHLVRDPKTGQLVAERRRKQSRRRPRWEDELGRWTGEDEFDDAMGFTEDDFLTSDMDEDEDEEDDS